MKLIVDNGKPKRSKKPLTKSCPESDSVLLSEISMRIDGISDLAQKNILTKAYHQCLENIYGSNA